ncbi:hypothetical protein [Xanthomonas sacchari]|uniref:hypothetical protein n=1 Tax=Xanthomonas sacchari TaxID=56458 RepID=UPI003B20F142
MQAFDGMEMRSRNSKIRSLAFAVAMLCNALLAGCAHQLGPGMESARRASELGLAGCWVTEPMRRYQALDYADQVGNPMVSSSPEWEQAMSMMQPGDQLRHVACRNGVNYFGLFRGGAALLKFGAILY